MSWSCRLCPPLPACHKVVLHEAVRVLLGLLPWLSGRLGLSRVLRGLCSLYLTLGPGFDLGGLVCLNLAFVLGALLVSFESKFQLPLHLDHLVRWLFAQLKRTKQSHVLPGNLTVGRRFLLTKPRSAAIKNMS